MTALRIDDRRLKDRVRGRRVSFADGLYERWLARHGLRLADLGEQMAYGKDGAPEHVYVQALFDNDFNQVWSDALPKWLVDVQTNPNVYRLNSLHSGMESLGIRAWPPRSWTGSYRRQPKGRRAKSGQWWRRPDPWLSAPLTWRESQSVKKAARMRPPEPMPDWRERVVIDERAGPIDPALLAMAERARRHRELFPDYFKGEPPQATYNPSGDKGAW